MAKDKQRSGSSGKPGVGKQGQGGESSDDDQSRSGSAQQEQGGNVAQQDGASDRNRDEERLHKDAQSGSSPRSQSDVPDEGKVG